MEFVRHRVFSFAQESTRYCNYSKDKFGNELTFIIPCWLENIVEGNYEWEDQNPFLTAGGSDKEYGYDDSSNTWLKDSEKNLTECKWAIYPHYNYFFKALQEAEDTYNLFLNLGWKPQQARSILPNSLKTELVMTGFVSDWKHFFKLRDVEAAHPQARELAKPLHEEFINNNW